MVSARVTGLPAGRRDRRIAIEFFTVVVDSTGEPVKTWQLFAALWAQAIPVRGAERIQEQQPDATLAYRFKVLWLPGVTVEQRILFDGLVYDITAVIEINRREGLELYATARTPAAP